MKTNNTNNNNSSSKTSKNPRGKSHSKSESKTTVGVYLPRILVEKARNHQLNLSRVTEQALSSILDYLEHQNSKPSSFLGPASFGKEGGGGPDRIRTSDLLHVKQMS